MKSRYVLYTLSLILFALLGSGAAIAWHLGIDIPQRDLITTIKTLVPATRNAIAEQNFDKALVYLSTFNYLKTSVTDRSSIAGEIEYFGDLLRLNPGLADQRAMLSYHGPRSVKKWKHREIESLLDMAEEGLTFKSVEEAFVAERVRELKIDPARLKELVRDMPQISPTR